MEKLPTPLIAQIVSLLSYKDIQSLLYTNKQLYRILQKEVFYKDIVQKQFVFGPWAGTWTNDTMIFNNDSILEKIYCKSIVYRNVDHSNTTYYKLYVTLKKDYESSITFYEHLYFKDLHQWLKSFFKIPRSVIWISTQVPLHRPLKYYNVPSNYRKRDHCSLIGITLCFHQCEDPRWKNSNFSQRIGFNHDRKFDIWSQGFDKVKLHLSSEVMIHPHTRWTSDNKLVNEPGRHTIIYFKVTSTECTARTPNPTHYESMKEYHDTLELCCNAMYSIIKKNSYESILTDAQTKVQDLAIRLHRLPETIELDVPKSEEHMWELIQNMKVYQHHYPSQKSSESDSE